MKFFGLLIPPLILNINEKVCSNCVFYKKIVTFYDIVHGEHDYEGRCEKPTFILPVHRYRCVCYTTD